MAESDIDAIIATTDGDTTWGSDLRGAMTTIKTAVTRRHIRDETIGSSRMASDGTHALTSGPWWNHGNTPAQTPGQYNLGLSEVRGGTPDVVKLVVITGATTSNAYYVMYDMADDGHPTNLVYSWGPFSATAVATVELTGQTTTIVGGMYWCGTMTPTGNGGSPVFSGARPCLSGPVRENLIDRVVMSFNYADATPRSVFTASMRTNSVYEAAAQNVAFLLGKDT